MKKLTALTIGILLSSSALAGTITDDRNKLELANYAKLPTQNVAFNIVDNLSANDKSVKGMVQQNNKFILGRDNKKHSYQANKFEI